MNLHARLIAIAAFVLLAAPGSAFAQYTGGLYTGRSDNPNGPTVSPYLNLLQNNNQLNGIPNYQSLVRPLLDQQSAIQRQGNSLQRLQQQVNTQGASGGTGQRATGHHTSFMYYSHFYTPPRQR
jgi:hypothetical protein